jgi:hypothetical protein
MGRDPRSRRRSLRYLKPRNAQLKLNVSSTSDLAKTLVPALVGGTEAAAHGCSARPLNYLSWTDRGPAFNTGR